MALSNTNGSLSEYMLFAFDEEYLPWRGNLKLTLVSAEKYPANPVMRCGPTGSSDVEHATLYGTVMQDHGQLFMRYLGMLYSTVELVMPDADLSRYDLAWIHLDGDTSTVDATFAGNASLKPGLLSAEAIDHLNGYVKQGGGLVLTGLEGIDVTAMLENGLNHPNAAGHRLAARAVMEIIEHPNVDSI